MTNTTELRKDFKNSVLALYELEGKSLEPMLLNLIADNFDHFCSIGIEQALKAKVEEIKAFIMPKVQKFIDKVESYRARSVETYADMKEIKEFLTKHDDENSR